MKGTSFIVLSYIKKKKQDVVSTARVNYYQLIN